MRVLVVEPECEPYVKEIDGSLKSMQKLVGGWIECIYPHEDESVIVCNEEGKIIGLPMNRPIVVDCIMVDMIAGTFFICNAPVDSEDFQGLTDEQITYYTELYRI